MTHFAIRILPPINLLLIMIIVSAAYAIKIEVFSNTDTYIARAKDLVVAECVPVPEREAMDDGIHEVEIDILETLKGDRKKGPLRIATIHDMKPGTIYLLRNTGGQTLNTDFLAISELSVVPMPARFSPTDLKGKELKEQIQYMFAQRLYEVERKVAPLLAEKQSLEKSIADRQYGRYQSDGLVKLGPVIQVNTLADGMQRWIEVDGKQLQWSQSSPGKTGYFCFEKKNVSWKPYWEFASCKTSTIEDLAGKSLAARFQGLFSTGGDDAIQWGQQSIGVCVGQVILARTVDDLNTIYAIRIEKQSSDTEDITAHYAVVGQEKTVKH